MEKIKGDFFKTQNTIKKLKIVRNEENRKNEKDENNPIKIKIANNYFSRLKGLMFKKTIDTALLFKIPNSKKRQRSAIHSCFMRFEIAIIFIDKEKKVYEIANLKPWKFYTPKKPAKYIIEFKKEDFKEIDLKINDKIIIKKDNNDK